MNGGTGRAPSPGEVRRTPWGLRRIVRWSESSLAPADYWGDRYPDVLHERVDGFLSGVLAGVAIAGFISVMFILLGGCP